MPEFVKPVYPSKPRVCIPAEELWDLIRQSERLIEMEQWRSQQAPVPEIRFEALGKVTVYGAIIKALVELIEDHTPLDLRPSTFQSPAST